MGATISCSSSYLPFTKVLHTHVMVFLVFLIQGWARSGFTLQYQYQYSIEGKCQAISKSILTWLQELSPKINFKNLDVAFQYWFNIKSHLNGVSKLNIKIKRWILSSQDQNQYQDWLWSANINIKTKIIANILEFFKILDIFHLLWRHCYLKNTHFLKGIKT